MPIHHTFGNLFNYEVEAVVNPVNTQGVMGKGLALEFKTRYPDNFHAYRKACQTGALEAGKNFVFERGKNQIPKYVFNFATKEKFSNPSRMVWIKDGLKDLRQKMTELGIKSVAIPALGCGLGKLLWSDVRKEIEEVFKDCDETVYVFAPQEG